MSFLDKKGFSTRAVHAGERQSDLGGLGRPVSGPIHPSVGYTHETSGDLDAVLGDEKSGYVYSARYTNPTIAAFEQAVADLEGAEAGYAFSSGMAALHIAFLAAGATAGSHVVAAADIYGATYSLLKGILGSMGVTTHFVNVLDPGEIEAAVLEFEPVVLFAETISNPLLRVVNINTLSNLVSGTHTKLIIDNTFCSPYLCQPIQWGADAVVHSATKFIGGHGDVMAGIVLGTAEFRSDLLRVNKLVGSNTGPFEAWLAHRGLKTLPLRMKQQSENALQIARWLESHPKIDRVDYPYLESHPQRALAQELTGGRGGGAILTMSVKGAGKPDIFKLMESFELIQAATTLGDVYSLALYPAISSHRTLTHEERQALGIGDEVLRLSIGIESVEDIQADLEQGLNRI